MVKKLTNADGLPTILTLDSNGDRRTEIARKAALNVAIMVHNGELGDIDGWTGDLRAGYFSILGLDDRPVRKSAYHRKLTGPEKVYQEELGKLGYS